VAYDLVKSCFSLILKLEIYFDESEKMITSNFDIVQDASKEKFKNTKDYF